MGVVEGGGTVSLRITTSLNPEYLEVLLLVLLCLAIGVVTKSEIHAFRKRNWFS